MLYDITVSGATYFEALDHAGTEAARLGVPAPTELARAGKGYRARFCGLDRSAALAVLEAVETSGDPKWISMLLAERGNDTAAELRAARACQKDAVRIRALLFPDSDGA